MGAGTSVPMGRSPRVRGSRKRKKPNARDYGSITACAGKPRSPTPTRAMGRVDHRVCGEAPRQSGQGRDILGRSPRVRGSRSSMYCAHPELGSITACAGKPLAPVLRPRPARVDHRVCGEADGRTWAGHAHVGRSPRVRGSPQAGRQSAARPGSITACAGKPPALPIDQYLAWVDHRVCGEAPLMSRIRCTSRGRSPRVRGSPALGTPADTPVRSITACAGKPIVAPHSINLERVDHRVCGEAPNQNLRR